MDPLWTGTGPQDPRSLIKYCGLWVPNSEAVNSQTRAFLTITDWLWASGLSAPVPGQLTLISQAPWAETGPHAWPLMLLFSGWEWDVYMTGTWLL